VREPPAQPAIALVIAAMSAQRESLLLMVCFILPPGYLVCFCFVGAARATDMPRKQMTLTSQFTVNRSDTGVHLLCKNYLSKKYRDMELKITVE
jgi:hypothetical protein